MVEKGGKVSGTTRKDTRRKPRWGVQSGEGGGDGWGQGELWRENADNCTGTTIK